MRIERQTWDLDELMQEEILASGNYDGTSFSQLDAGLRRAVKKAFNAASLTVMNVCVKGLRCSRENPAVLPLIALGGGLGQVFFSLTSVFCRASAGMF